MGNLDIVDADFSFEWDSTENSTPPGSADLPTQPVVTSTQHNNEDFYYDFVLVENSTPPGSADIEKQPVLTIVQAEGFDFIYHVLPVGFADSYTVNTHTTTQITVAGAPFSGLDLGNKAVIITSGVLLDYFFYITGYTDSKVVGSGIDLTGLVDDVDTFIIHIPAIVTQEDTEPPGSADISDQDVLQSMQHWSEDFISAIVVIKEKTFHIHVQTKGKKPLGDADITITDLDHPAVPPQTIHTNKFGNVSYEATLFSRYNFAISKKEFQPFSFELGMMTSQPPSKAVRTLLQDFKSILVLLEEKKAVDAKAISQQTVAPSVQTLTEDFEFVFLLVENEDPVTEVP